VQLPVLNNTATEAPAGGCSAGSCGSTDDQMNHLPEHIRQKVFNHPCYSEEAHHYFARMHVAVAPACNIQCKLPATANTIAPTNLARRGVRVATIRCRR